MHRKKIDSQIERQILIAMIMSKEFLFQISSLDIDSIKTPLFKIIAFWCLDYFHEYNDSPKKHIESIYLSWAEKKPDEDTLVSSVNDFLESLSDQYDSNEDLNIPYLLDRLGTYLRDKKIENLRDDLDSTLHQGDFERAEKVILDYSELKIGVGVGIDVLNDQEAWERAFIEPVKPLIAFPRPADIFFNPALTRDALIGIQGPEKRGKTWWCIEFVMRALRQRKKVALFEVGDLSESQIMLRLGTRLASRPLRKEFCGLIDIPYSIKRPQNNRENNEIPQIEYNKRKIDKIITKKACIKAIQRFMRGCGISKETPYIMVSIHPNDSINVQGISNILDRWNYEKNFIPDVIVIDYADILASEKHRNQYRDEINETWKALRKLSQERHALVITPTQATRESYNATTQAMRHSSEDKRKLAHVTGMLGLNQTEQEKELGIMRLNWVVGREFPFSTNRCLYVGQCLSLGRAFCCSEF